jgi:hypothetical protein
MSLFFTMVVANPPHKENHKNYDPRKSIGVSWSPRVYEKRLWVRIKLAHLTKKTTMPRLLHYWKWSAMKDLTSLHIASLKVTEHVANLNPSPLQTIHMRTIFFIITWHFVFRNKTCGHCPQVCMTSYCYRN